jgi:NAD(P)-dependent dehydrogenase (short-subunit alcohol dehydrogenase family)
LEASVTLLAGKVAIVTGASSGLGLATATVFAEQGARVVMADVVDAAGEAAADELRGSGFEVSYLHTDVASSSDVDALVEHAERLHGRLDAMVANAGILGQASFRPIEDVSDEDWARVLDVNLSGAFRCFRAAVPALKRSGGGALSVSSSVSGVFGSMYRLAYGSSKGGIGALVRGLAVELAPARIRVNAVAPGSMETNISASLGRTRSEIAVTRPDASEKKEHMRGAWGDQSRTRDVANVHLFLCSHLADYVNGETIVADGGFSMWNGT